MVKFKSFQFIPDSMTVIEKFENGEEGAIEYLGKNYSYFMPIEEAGRTFALVLQEDEKKSEYSSDFLNLYEINDMMTCSEHDSTGNWGSVLVSKKYLYDKLKQHGFKPEDNSFEKEEKQKVLHEVFYSALAG